MKSKLDKLQGLDDSKAEEVSNELTDQEKLKLQIREKRKEELLTERKIREKERILRMRENQELKSQY